MKILDKYIISQFLKMLAGSLIFCIALFLVNIYITDIRYFMHDKIPAGLSFSYIINSIPEIIIYMLPSAALLSTCIVFGNMNSSNEIVALYNGRISFYRLIVPLTYTIVVMAVLSFFFFEFIAVDSSGKAVMIRDEFRKRTGGTHRSMLNNRESFFKSGRMIYYFDYFEYENTLMLAPSVFEFDAKGSLLFQLNAADAHYDKNNHTWVFRAADIIRLDDKGNYTSESRQVFAMHLEETPEYFKSSPIDVTKLKMKDALAFIKAKREAGQSTNKYEVDFHHRFTWPFSAIITLLIGCVVGIFLRKAVLVLSFFFSIIISSSYFVMMGLSEALGKAGVFPPAAAAWLPNVLFTAAVFAFLKFKK